MNDGGERYLKTKNKGQKRHVPAVVILFFIVIVCFAVSFIIFKVHDIKGRKSRPYEILYSAGESYWINKSGAFRFEGELLYYYDPEDNKKYVACNKSGCRHDSDNCPAHIETKSAGYTFGDDGVYYLAQDKNNIFDNWLYHVNMDGSSRKKIHRFKNTLNVDDAVYKYGRLYFSYSNSIDKKGNELEKHHAGIFCYDIRKNKEYKIFEDDRPCASVQALAVKNDKVFFVMNYSDLTYKEAVKHKNDDEYVSKRSHSVLYSVEYGKNTENKAEKISGKIDWITDLPIVGNYLIYSNDHGTLAYNLKDGKSRPISREPSEAISVLDDSDRFILISFEDGSRKTITEYDSRLKEKRHMNTKMFCMGISKENVYFSGISHGNITFGSEGTDDFFKGKGKFKSFKNQS